MKWEKFAKEHSLISLPASPIHVSLYLVFLLDSGATYSTVSSAFYSVKWAIIVRSLITVKWVEP
jgi:hypothetical protein